MRSFMTASLGCVQAVQGLCSASLQLVGVVHTNNSVIVGWWTKRPVSRFLSTYCALSCAQQIAQISSVVFCLYPLCTAINNNNNN